MALQGKACLITGGGKGIGRATALRLCGDGANVLAVARTAADVEETARQAADAPGRCVPAVADVTRSSDVTGLIERVQQEFGQLDVLINNAGMAPLKPLEQFTDELQHALVEVNINAVLRLCRIAWPALKASQGTIVNISSQAALDPFPGFAAYGATKAWVNTFTQALAGEGKEHGITVFGIGPGAVDTAMLRQAFPKFPAEKTLQPEHIAEAIEWILDDRCRHMTGQTIYVRK